MFLSRAASYRLLSVRFMVHISCYSDCADFSVSLKVVASPPLCYTESQKGDAFMVDFDKIFLSKYDLKIMNAVRFGAVVKLHVAFTEQLLSVDFIAPYAFSETQDEYVITDAGLRYLEYLETKQQAEEQKKREEEKHQRSALKLEWVSIIISNLIALAALIVSILK